MKKTLGCELQPESMVAARLELFIDTFFGTIWPESDAETRLVHQRYRLDFETRWQEQIKTNQENARDEAQKMHEEMKRQMAAARLGVDSKAPQLIGPDGSPLGQT